MGYVILGAAAPSTKNADPWLAQVAAHKGQQKQLQTLLVQIQAALKTAQAKAALLCKAQPNSPACVQANALVAAIQKDVIACQNAIKACAQKAANAAQTAVSKGASQVDVVAAANAGAAASQPASTGGSATYQPQVQPGGTALVSFNEPTIGPDVSVETSNPSLQPDGTVSVGPDAKTVATPQSDDGSGTVPAATPAGASLGALAVFGAVLVGGYLLFKK